MKKVISNAHALFNGTVFIKPILDSNPDYIYTVMQKNEFGKYEVIGKIYMEYDKLCGKPIYKAKDYQGKRIWTRANELSHIKSLFKEHGKELVGITPPSIADKRESELKMIRELKNQKSKTIER